MKNRAAILLATLCLLFAVFVSAHAESNATVLVYLCGSDIQEDACIDLYEMAEAEVDDSVNLVILAGGAEEWVYDELRGGRRNLTVIRDYDFEFVEDWGTTSMGSEESLYEFLEYGMSNYPAEKMIVILWNHGSGAEGGICADVTADDDALSIVEINDALYDLYENMGDFHIDIFGCDACMMASYELASILSHYDIDCFIGSQEVEPYLGWHYTEWLRALGKNPRISNNELCKIIVDSFMRDSLADDPDDYYTLSAISLSEFDTLESSIEDLAVSLTQTLKDGNLASIRRERSRLYTFGSYYDGSWDMVDLGAMLDAYAQFSPEKAAEARRQLSKVVIANRYTENLGSCSGLSVFLPQDTTSEYEDYREGMDISIYIPNWFEFINSYTASLEEGQYTFTATVPERVSDETTISGFLSSLASLGGDYTWDPLSNTYDISETSSTGEEILISASEYGFISTLSKKDLAYLDYVEGSLMVDVSDDDILMYIDLGLMQNNLIDWKKGTVLSLFDGTWPIFGGQLIPLYDQSSNEQTRRSLIPVKLNGEYTYLVVVFDSESSEGRIIGANAGYGDNGLPIRSTTKLKAGDVIIPIYTMYYGDPDSDDDLEESEFEGDAIIWTDDMTVTYEDISDSDDPMSIMFCFIFNDIFGDYTMSDVISFEL